MRNLITSRQRERIIERYVAAQHNIDNPSPMVSHDLEVGIQSGISYCLEALLIDRERGADWREFNEICDEINAAVDAARRPITDADLGQLAETQEWAAERAS